MNRRAYGCGARMQLKCRFRLRLATVLRRDSYFLNIGSTSVLGQDYEQNGVDKKLGRVRLNRLGGRKMGQLYGGREAEIGGAVQKEQESVAVERSKISRGFRKRHKDRDTSERILGFLTVRASWNSIFMQQSRIVLPSTLALPFRIALVFVLVSAAVLQGAYSHAEKHMHVQRMRHKIASREGKASSVLASRPLAGSTCFREISRMAWCAQGSLQRIRHRSRCEARKAASATRQCHS